ncbi:alcohol dehydrogenase catalytic domain-containing protein [Streptomyces sp. NPDC126510]|uniref:alcohol dehydrogenase catalytic domain-containing protein n=1 Tax=Streptomyces sp. NPDC126510 TaxID=3155317 RepID=UPI003333AC19
MRALWYVRPGQLEWRESPEPQITDPAAAIVRPVAVATCDLDGWLVRGEIPVAGPFPVGHEFVAEVVEVGEAVTGIAPGDRVSVPFQISCGRCAPCRAGRTGRCRSVPAGSAYGMGPLSHGLQWGGAVADLVLVPYADDMCLPLPAGLDAAALAGLSDNLVDGWRTVAPYLGGPGETADARVLVFGGGSGGLYAAGIAAALGAEVTYVDRAESRCAIAERLGARAICEPAGNKYPSHPIVVHTSQDQNTLRTALLSTSSAGVCTDTGIFFNGDVPLPLLEMYTKGVTFVTGRIDARAAMPAALDLITSGRLDPSPVVGETAPWGEAPVAWAEHTGRLVLTRT